MFQSIDYCYWVVHLHAFFFEVVEHIVVQFDSVVAHVWAPVYLPRNPFTSTITRKLLILVYNVRILVYWYYSRLNNKLSIDWLYICQTLIVNWFETRPPDSMHYNISFIFHDVDNGLAKRTLSSHVYNMIRRRIVVDIWNDRNNTNRDGQTKNDWIKRSTSWFNIAIQTVILLSCSFFSIPSLNLPERLVQGDLFNSTKEFLLYSDGVSSLSFNFIFGEIRWMVLSDQFI